MHSIEELLTGLRRLGMPVPDDLDDAVILTDHAVEARFPSTGEPVTIEEYRQAVELAGRAVEWATGVVRRRR